ncbi:GHKL domain-containing protein [Puteibacter caeruleilacunae]|nr:GHKL domain-containing protein [Puteibacter caeruleilacunae]
MLKKFLAIITFSILIISIGYSKDKIMVIHSYHQGLDWTDNITKGIKGQFQEFGDSLELYVEYLDTKRNPGTTYFNRLSQFYETKHLNQNFKAIIAVDNVALKFVTTNRDKYFKDIPVVFAGINNFQPSMIEGDPLITGVCESADFHQTLDLINHLHPNLNKLYIINDNKTTTAKENKKILKLLESKYSYQFEYLEDLTPEELADSIRNIPPNDIIMLLTYNSDKNGNFMSYKESIELVYQNAQNPIYSVWQFFLGRGIVGGYLTSGKNQGIVAAQMAIQILRGKTPSTIPIINIPPQNFAFDNNLLKQHNIEFDMLPPGAVIINKPADFYQVNKRWIFWASGIVIFLFIVILVLVNANFQKNKAQKSYQEERIKLKRSLEEQTLIANIVSALNSTNDFKGVIRQILHLISKFYNAGKVTLFSFSENDSINEIIGSLVVEQDDSIQELQPEEFGMVNDVVIEMKKENSRIICNSLSDAPAEVHPYLISRNIASMILLPLSIDNKIMGMASLTKSKDYNWSEGEIKLFETIAQVIANAWERNYQMEMHLESKEKHTDALHILEKSSRMASVGVIASGITHEIRQPLNAIKVTADSVLFWQKKNPQDVPEILGNKMKSISEGAQRIDDIINQMRNYWIKSDPSQRSVIDLNAVIQNALNLVERQIYNHGIFPEKNLAYGKILIHGNSLQLEQVIINLIVNAIQALDDVDQDDRRIIISTHKGMTHATIEISDNGPGIDTSAGEKLFDPFYSTKQTTHGTGLGLAIVKTFTDQMKGQLQYTNNDNGGACFKITFALAEEQIFKP